MKILFYARGEEGQQWLDALRQTLPHAEICQWGSMADQQWQADYALVWNAPSALFESQQRLKGIVNLGAGVDKLLANPALPNAVPVYKLRDAGMASWMTDYVRYGVSHVARDMDRYRTQQAASCWQPFAIEPKADWSIGILGLGAIGSEVAQALRSDGYPVLGWSRNQKDIPDIESYAGEVELDTLLAKCRVLVNILPATSNTRGLLNAQRLQQLPQGAMVISCGRGEVIDEPALLELCVSGHLRGALLDVFAEEPLPVNNPLWNHPSVIVTPHISAPTPIEGATRQIGELLQQLEEGVVIETVDRLRGY